ncbi:hypothetical protein [Hymenobacter arizonensis]|uniref:hypothetical protein n=1 Tax=Hymenobacter arizonensis TaxID=1227077 RepID=UPI0011602B68|nr:hypothetical protein [Hymenobacter arizonensis]
MRRTAVVYSALAGAFVFLNYDASASVWPTVALTGALFAGIAAFTWFITMKRQALLFESTELIVNDAGITRTQLDTPTKTLAASDIVRIEHFGSGVFAINGKRAADMIWMPAQVEFPEKLAEELRSFSPVLSLPAPAWYRRYASLLGLAVLPLMYFFFTSESKAVTVLVGTILIGGLGYSQWIIQHSKDIDKRIKLYSRFGWLILFWLAVTFVAKLS